MSTHYYIVNDSIREKQLKEYEVVKHFIANVTKKATDLYLSSQISENTLEDITNSANTWKYFVDTELGDYDFLVVTHNTYHFMEYTNWYSGEYYNVHTIQEAVQFVEKNKEEYYIIDEYGERHEPNDILMIIKDKLGN